MGDTSFQYLGGLRPIKVSFTDESLSTAGISLRDIESLNMVSIDNIELSVLGTQWTRSKAEPRNLLPHDTSTADCEALPSSFGSSKCHDMSTRDIMEICSLRDPVVVLLVLLS
jgi:hypothetical protein